MINYKNDDSFFTTIVSKENCFLGWPIQEWFLRYDISKFRLIKDDEIDNDRLTLSEIQDIYPGIASIGITMNPWARVVYRLERILKLNDFEKNNLASRYKEVDFRDFSAIVTTAFDSDVIKTNKPSSICLPQLHWLSWENEGKTEYATYIVRGEHVEKDMQQLKDYFCIDQDLNIKFPIRRVSYRNFYTPETKKIVATYFGEDIEKFKYRF